ncbi:MULTISPECIES: hypothetical protein [unclassified Sphingomonas]|uniref:hypothetical protein n=1 Tax=unclassified Sphingomonas TaxID=196159 RepID=UPI00226A56C6|nr:MULTISPECIES: hypothetical protein [unclassified Sphingomonas]
MSPRLILIVAAVLAILAATYGVYHHGETAGSAKVEAKTEHRHTAAVADARTDERAAKDAAASIAKHVARADDLSTAALQTTIKDLRDALDAVPPAPAGAPVPAAPVDGLRDSLNAGIARANRAADAVP